MNVRELRIILDTLTPATEILMAVPHGVTEQQAHRLVDLGPAWIMPDGRVEDDADAEQDGAIMLMVLRAGPVCRAGRWHCCGPRTRISGEMVIGEGGHWADPDEPRLRVEARDPCNDCAPRIYFQCVGCHDVSDADAEDAEEVSHA